MQEEEGYLFKTIIYITLAYPKEERRSKGWGGVYNSVFSSADQKKQRRVVHGCTQEQLGIEGIGERQSTTRQYVGGQGTEQELPKQPCSELLGIGEVRHFQGWDRR